MNPQWLLIRRLRGPALLLTFGLTALLNQWDILSFGQSWPLYLIVLGLLTLAERAALARTPLGSYGDPSMGQQYGGQPYGAQPPYGVPYPTPTPSQTPYQTPSTAVVPVPPSGLQGNDPSRRS
jgi:hypothetical protein